MPAVPALTANSPGVGSFAWAAFTIRYGGTTYNVSAGSTSSRFVWWRLNGGSPLLQAGDDVPADLTIDDLVLFANKNGTPIHVQQAGLVEGGLIVDGSIFADALSANSVTGEKILANSINATHIVASSITGNEIAANTIAANNVAADVMVTNDIYARNGLFVKGAGLSGVQIDANGFLQTDSAGASRVNFPSDPTLPNLVRSELITDGITAQGRVALRGVDNEVSRNSAIVLQTGTTPPANSPTIAGVYETVDSAFDSATGYGLTRVGTSWYWMSNLTTLRRRTDAGVYSSQVLPFPDEGSGGSTGNVSATGQPVLIGSVWYVPGRSSGGPGYTKKFIYMFNSTTFAYLGKWQMPGYGNAIGGSGDNDSSVYITAATDGTDLYTAYYDVNANKSVVCRITNPSTGTRAVAQTWTLPPFSGSTTFARYSFLVGSFDFGSLRFIFSSGFGSTTVYNAGTLADTSATESWVTSNANGIGWDGTRFWMQVTSRLFRTSTNKTARTLTGAYTWYDSDPAGGGNYETLVSPIVTFTQPARQGLTVTTPPPADDGTNNAPDTARFYVGTTTANLRAQGAAFLNSALFLDVDPATGNAPGVNPLFPNGTAALIRSAGGTLVMRGDGTIDVPSPILPVNATNKLYVDGRTAVAHANRYLVAQYQQAPSAYYTVKLDGALVAESGMTWNASTNKWTISTAGIFQCNAAFRVGGTGVRACRIMVNGNSQVEAALGGGTGSAEETSQVSRAIRLAVGDTVWLEGLHFVGGSSATVYANKNTFMDITRVSS